MLLETIFATLQPDEQILVCTLDPVVRVLADSPQEAMDWALSQENAHRNVYFGVAPRKRGQPDTPNRVTCVWADIDLDDFGGSVQAANEAIEEYPAKQTFTVSTGHGWHLYWMLTEPISPEKAPPIMTAIRDCISGDNTCDATRLLRVPGTLNVKDPLNPVPCLLDPNQICLDAVYAAEDLLRLARTPAKVTRLVVTGDARGYHSRSERDYAVCKGLVPLGVSDDTIFVLFHTNKVGDRVAEDGGDKYLERTINKVRSQLPGSNSQNNGVFTELNDSYLYPSKDGLYSVSTFVFSPRRLLRGDKSGNTQEDAFLGDIHSGGHVWPDIILQKTAFGSTSALIKALSTAEWSWYGTDLVTRKLAPYILEKLRTLGTIDAIGTRVIGRHQDLWVAPGITFGANKIYTPDEAPYVYVPTGREVPPLQYTFPDETDYAELVRLIFALLPKINDPKSIIPMIGWYFASPLKPVLEEAGIRMPNLNVFGTRGGGKSSTILRAFQPLMGYAQERAYTCRTTPFVLLSLFASSNALPISFSEYRANQRVAQNREDLLHYILMAYDTGYDARGRADQTTEQYPLSAPFSVDGEDPIADPAARERTIAVALRPWAVQDGSDQSRAFAALITLPLNKFAGRYIQRTLSENTTSVRERHTRGIQFLADSGATTLPNRVRNNLAVCYAGLEMYNEVALTYGAAAIPLEKGLFDGVLKSTLQHSETGKTRAMADDFVERVINAFDQQRSSTIAPLFYAQYESATNVLWVHFTSAYQWWADARRKTGTSVLEAQSIRMQLEERGTDYVVGDRWIVDTLDFRERRCVGLDIKRCVAFGLDIPKTMRTGLTVHVTGGTP